MGSYRSKPTPDASTTEAGARRHWMPTGSGSSYAKCSRGSTKRCWQGSPMRWWTGLPATVRGWVPQGPTDAVVKEVEAFAEAAKRVGYAEPSKVDAYPA